MVIKVKGINRPGLSRDIYRSLASNSLSRYNRTLLEEHALKAIDFAIAENLKAAMIYIDLDNFKPINDNLGHHSGDEVLKIVGQRLKHVVRSSDTVARLGGDEFAVLLHGAKDRGSIHFLSSKLLTALREPIEIEAGTVTITASLGVIIIPDDGTQLDMILRLSDSAMYEAKKTRGNYSPLSHQFSPLMPSV